MPRKWLLALLAALFITPALAQVIQPIQLQRPVPVRIIPPAGVEANDDVADRVMTIEDAKAQIAKLRSERRELNAKLAEAVATIDQMTRKGGALVRAYCDGENVSRSTAGATENCGLYDCSPVEGTCRKTCNVTDDCAGATVCDTGTHQCVRNG